MEHLVSCQVLYKGLYLVSAHLIFTAALEVDTLDARVLQVIGSTTYPKSWRGQEETQEQRPSSALE